MFNIVTSLFSSGTATQRPDNFMDMQINNNNKLRYADNNSKPENKLNHDRIALCEVASLNQGS
jgi:hypothetical protein